MIRKLSLAALCAITVGHPVAFATTQNVFPQGFSYDVPLPAQEPQVYTNASFKKAKYDCKIISEALDNPFSLTVLDKTGSLNNVKLSKGQSLDIIVHDGEHVLITAASGGKVKLTNNGVKKIIAHCESTQ